MPHIHTKQGQHDLTASAFILREESAETKVLLHVHKKYGKLLQPGGHVELHENVWQAIIHEIAEETGYEASQLRVLQPRDRVTTLTGVTIHPQPMSINTHAIPGGHFHTDIAFIFVTDGLPNMPLSEGESTDLRWLTNRQVQALGDDEIYPDTKQLVNHVFNTCLPAWEIVPMSDYES